ncbi:unnamed protein product [Absidia cylindrospora]
MAFFMWPFGIAWNLTWTLLSFANRLISRRSITSNQASSTANTSQQRQDPHPQRIDFYGTLKKCTGRLMWNLVKKDILAPWKKLATN